MTIRRSLVLVLLVAFAECVSNIDKTGGQARGAQPGAHLLPSTFTMPADAPRESHFPILGRWKAGSTELVLVPRASSRPSEAHIGIFGAVPRGPAEGVLWLISQKAQGEWQGVYVRAAGLAQRRTVLRHVGNLDVVRWEREDGQQLEFRRAGPINLPLLRSIRIIGHRGLSLGREELMNSVLAIRHSWLFGCSGVELDVTVPYAENRQPLPDGLRIHHGPEWKSEIFGDDGVRASDVRGAPDLKTALEATHDAGIPLVYFDPKLRWLMRREKPAARAALEQLVATAGAHASATGLRIIVGTETSGRGEAADMIAHMRDQQSWPSDIAWAMEITRGTDVNGAYARLSESTAARRPDVASFNLLRIRGGGGGVLRVFVSSISHAMEAAFARTPQPHVYWTAHDEQFDAALAVIRRMGQFPNAAIITPYPHRLAFHLATQTSH